MDSEKMQKAKEIFKNLFSKNQTDLSAKPAGNATVTNSGIAKPYGSNSAQQTVSAKPIPTAPVVPTAKAQDIKSQVINQTPSKTPYPSNTVSLEQATQNGLTQPKSNVVTDQNEINRVYNEMVADRNAKLNQGQAQLNELNKMQSTAKAHGGLVSSQETEYGTYYKFGDGTGYWIENEDAISQYAENLSTPTTTEEQVAELERNFSILDSDNNPQNRKVVAEQIYNLLRPFANKQVKR